MKSNKKREVVRSFLGKKVRITYFRRDPTKAVRSNLDREEVYEGTLTLYKFTLKYPYEDVKVKACIDGEDGKKFPIIPLDGPLHDCSICGTPGYDGKKNGYWELEILE